MLTKVKIIEVPPPPRSPLTCWNVQIFFTPKTLTSLGTFYMPVSSPDQIWQGDRILNFVLISSSRLNQFDITVGLAPIAQAIDKFFAVRSVISG